MHGSVLLTPSPPTSERTHREPFGTNVPFYALVWKESDVNDKPLYINAETDKWFDRYIKTVAERDAALARVNELEVFQHKHRLANEGWSEAVRDLAAVTDRCARYEAAIKEIADYAKGDRSHRRMARAALAAEGK